MIEVGLGLSAAGRNSLSLRAESSAIVAAMSSPPDRARQLLIDQAVTALVDAGVWSKIGVLYVFAAHASQAALLNWKSPAGSPALLVNSPTFTTDRGFSGDGASAYIDTQRAWNGISGIAQNDAHVGAVTRFSTNTQAAGLIGNGNVLIGRSSNNLDSRLNTSTTANGGAVSGASVTQHLLLSRTSSTNTDRYVSGVAAAASNAASAALATQNLAGLRFGGLFAASGLVLGALHAGSQLSASEAAAVSSALLAYMQGVGA